METCVICKESLHDGSKTVELREKGSTGINNASRERGDKFFTKAGLVVHDHCRRNYINPNVIKSLKRNSTSPISPPPLLRSEKQFSLKDNCLFCGTSIQDYSAKKKLFDTHAVQTTEFQTKVEKICNERNDEWSTEVKGRIEFARDLHAADAVYHNTCSANFRSGKNRSQMFSAKTDKFQIKRGRPTYRHYYSLLAQAETFLKDYSSREAICKAGEEVLVALYGGMPLEGLDLLRWRKFTTKTMAANRCSVVQVQSLPPTTDAANFHSMRVYLQCQYWKGKSPAELDPTDWGWTKRNNNLYPIEMSKQPAPDFLLKMIHCNCKTDCGRKNGIACSSGCGECRGVNYSNTSRISEELIDLENGDL